MVGCGVEGDDRDTFPEPLEDAAVPGEQGGDLRVRRGFAVAGLEPGADHFSGGGEVAEGAVAVGDGFVRA